MHFRARLHWPPRLDTNRLRTVFLKWLGYHGTVGGVNTVRRVNATASISQQFWCSVHHLSWGLQVIFYTANSSGYFLSSNDRSCQVESLQLACSHSSHRVMPPETTTTTTKKTSEFIHGKNAFATFPNQAESFAGFSPWANHSLAPYYVV